MTLAVSPVVKVFALVGLLAALVLGGGMTMLGRQQEDAAAEPLVLPKKQGGLLAAPAKAEQVAAKVAKRAAPSPRGTAPATAPTKPKRAQVRPVAPNGMPTTLMNALARNEVVVLSLYGRGSKVDPIARAEAKAGAAAARAGFVVLDVTRDQKAAEALTLKIGSVLRAPAVLVFTKPDVLAIHLDGFRDRETVAQAAQNALR